VKIATMEMLIVVHTVISVPVVNVEKNKIVVPSVLQMLIASPTGVKDLVES